MPARTPPRGITAARAALATATAGVPRGRRLLGLVALLGLPVIIVCLRVLFGVSGRGEGFANFANVVTYAYTQLVLPLALISMGTGAFGDEWAGGTAHYVSGLPVPRWALVVGRWLAVVRRALLFVLPAISLVYVLSLASFGEALAHYLPALLWVLAVVTALTGAYTAIFMCLGLALRRAVIISLVYAFAIEVATSKLPQAFATISLSFHARNVLWQMTGQDAFEPPTRDIFAVEPVSVTWSWTWIVLITVIALGLGTVALRRKESGGDSAARDAAET
jgi:ABC-type transport system involved in multi-copper enzyme maturation permease subunit